MSHRPRANSPAESDSWRLWPAPGGSGRSTQRVDEGDEHGDVEYALIRAEWHQQEAEAAADPCTAANSAWVVAGRVGYAATNVNPTDGGHMAAKFGHP